MIIYNVTTKVQWAIQEEWLQWMQEVHIPEMLDTGSFYDTRIMHLLDTDDDEGPTYAIQYFAHTIEDYQAYLAFYASTQRDKTVQKWGDQFIAFRSLMQTVQ